MIYTVFHRGSLPTEVIADSFEQVLEIHPKVIIAIDEVGNKYWGDELIGLQVCRAFGLSNVRQNDTSNYNPKKYVNELV